MKTKRCEVFNECSLYAEPLDDWHVSGSGDLLEKNWKCPRCGRTWREVYIYSCEIDNETDKVLKCEGC